MSVDPSRVRVSRRFDSIATASVVAGWPPPLALALSVTALGLQAPRARRLRRLRRAAHARDLERSRQPSGEPLERERAVARLTARTTGPQRAVTRAFCASSSVADAATSKLASIRDSVLLACWPPGPEDRLACNLTSSSGIETSRLMGSTSAMVT
jgi:hypothetical protein